MIFKLFRIRKILKDIKEGRENPVGFVAEELLEPVKIMVILVGIFGGLITIFFGILGFSSLMGGPYLGVKILFVFLVLFYIPFMTFSVIFFKIVKRMAKQITMKVWPKQSEPSSPHSSSSLLLS